MYCIFLILFIKIGKKTLSKELSYKRKVPHRTNPALKQFLAWGIKGLVNLLVNAIYH